MRRSERNRFHSIMDPPKAKRSPGAGTLSYAGTLNVTRSPHGWIPLVGCCRSNRNITKPYSRGYMLERLPSLCFGYSIRELLTPREWGVYRYRRTSTRKGRPLVSFVSTAPRIEPGRLPQRV